MVSNSTIYFWLQYSQRSATYACMSSLASSISHKNLIADSSNIVPKVALALVQGMVFNPAVCMARNFFVSAIFELVTDCGI